MEKIIQVTTIAVEAARFINAILYTSWDYSINKDGIKEQYTFAQFNTFPRRYVIGRNLSQKSVRLIDIVSGGIGSGTYAGINWIAVREDGKAVRYNIRESAVVIMQQRQALLINNPDGNVVLDTQQLYGVHSIYMDDHNRFAGGLYMNGGSESITIPEGLILESVNFNHYKDVLIVYSPTNSQVRPAFAGTYSYVGNKVNLNITELSHFNADPIGGEIMDPESGQGSPQFKAFYSDGKRLVAKLVFKVLEPGEYILPEAVNGYIVVDSVHIIPEPELPPIPEPEPEPLPGNEPEIIQVTSGDLQTVVGITTEVSENVIKKFPNLYYIK